ncbi:MAG TPA: peptidase M20, partial [Dokdonella sp.]|nr:peptidase M20 [Dokdonella sp.]
MKKTLAIAIALALPVLAAAAYAPKFDPKRLSDEVKVLSSDAFEGRGPATAGETKTVEYVVEQMKAAGLQPGGDLKD